MALMRQAVLETANNGNSFANLQSGEKPANLSDSSVSPSRLSYRYEGRVAVVATIKDGFHWNIGSALEYEEVFQQKMAG